MPEEDVIAAGNVNLSGSFDPLVLQKGSGRHDYEACCNPALIATTDGSLDDRSIRLVMDKNNKLDYLAIGHYAVDVLFNSSSLNTEDFEVLSNPGFVGDYI